MSIKTIAEQVGVSPATVSRVLNNPNYQCAKPGLRDNIWKIAMEQNYVPNEAARNLKKGISLNNEETCYIHVLVTRMDASQSDPFFTELLHVIESEIHRHMCILAKVWYLPLFSNAKKCQRENIRQMMDRMYTETERKPNGLIIIGKCCKDALRELNSRYKNVVSVNRNSTNYEVDEVLCDGEKVAGLAIDYLIQLGHKEIAYVGECHDEARYRGYIKALQKHGIDIKPSYVIETKQTEAEGFETMREILKRENRPTSIYCANDITAIGMLKCLNKYKSKYFTPSIISSDDIEEAQYTKPMLTTVRLPRDEMGRFALYLLLDRIRGGHKGTVRMELEGKLIVRNSCVFVGDSEWSDYII